jgi:hypothetical protein
MKSIVLAMVAAACAASTVKIDVETRTFRDFSGRARIFHGQNVVVKLPPYFPTTETFDFDSSIS